MAIVMFLRDELTKMMDNPDGIKPHSASLTPSKIFRYDELRYFRFGLALGISNILRNGFQLGPKKTLGKVLQPINSYARFPEYHFLGRYIEAHLKRFASRALQAQFILPDVPTGSLPPFFGS